MTPLQDLWLGNEPRPPAGSFGRLFRLDTSAHRDVVGMVFRPRRELADGVISPDGAAFARLRGSHTVLFAAGGLEALVESLGDPSIRIVYEERHDEL